VTIRNNKRAVVDFEGNRIFKQRLTSLCIIDRSDEQDRPELELYDAVTKYVSEFYNFAKQQNNRTMMFLLLIYQITQKKHVILVFQHLHYQRHLNSASQLNQQRPTLFQPDYSENDTESCVNTVYVL
jgi:hypothetical protein